MYLWSKPIWIFVRKLSLKAKSKCSPQSKHFPLPLMSLSPEFSIWLMKPSSTTISLKPVTSLCFSFPLLSAPQSYLILCNSMDCSPPVSSVHGIFQARILEWVVISFSSGSSQPRDRIQVSNTARRFFINWVMREALPFSRHTLSNLSLESAS